MEIKDPKSTESAGVGPGQETSDPRSDATSDETLHDLETTEEVAAQSEREHEGASPTTIPSPDGEIAEPRGGTNDPGPM